MKNLIITLSLLFFSLMSFAQASKPFNFTINAGVGVPILDGGLVGHIGLNPSYRLFKYVEVEGQVSLSYASIESAFLTGEQRTETNFNYLIGPRVYFTGADSNWRPFINLLLGSWSNTTKDDDREFKETDIGLSAGLFVVNATGLNLGISIETEGYLLAKVGYRF